MLIADTLFLTSSSYIPREVLGRLGGFGNTVLRKCLALNGREVGGR
jgi:hypothetical protein